MSFKRVDEFGICKRGGGWSEGGAYKHGEGFGDVGCEEYIPAHRVVPSDIL